MTAWKECEIDAIYRLISSASIALLVSGRCPWLCFLPGIHHTRIEYKHIQSAETSTPPSQQMCQEQRQNLHSSTTIKMLQLDIGAFYLHTSSRHRALIHARQSSYFAANTPLPSLSSTRDTLTTRMFCPPRTRSRHSKKNCAHVTSGDETERSSQAPTGSK